MAGLFLSGLYTDQTPQLPQEATKPDISNRIKDLEYQVGRLTLLNQALWELLREKLQVSDQDLERKANDVDLRDGIEDGRITETALKCPKCGRVSSSKHWRCLYCGLQFEKPVMG